MTAVGYETDAGVVERPALPVPFAMTARDRVPVQRYYDQEFYHLERRNLWPRTWQMACRLEEIPAPGDYVEYMNAGWSVIVVRVSPDEVRAYYNSCRHRGVKLVTDRGKAESGFVCSFHGWCYGLDGSNTFLYQPDLFAEHNRGAGDLDLRTCRVELWGGCAFVNFDDGAPPLAESIGSFAAVLDRWHVDSLRTEWWLSFRLPVNWKLAMEAFMEGYHVRQTHPQLLPPTARKLTVNYNSGEKIFTDRRATKEAQAAATAGMTREQFIDAQLSMMRIYRDGLRGVYHEKDVWMAEQLRGVELPDDPRERNTEWRRILNEAIVAWSRAAGIDVPSLEDLPGQGISGGVYFCFPNFFLLPGLTSTVSYRIRPLGPEECLFEIWSLARFAPGEEPAKPVTPVPMAGDDPRTPPVPAQDFANLPKQQEGLHAGGIEFMRLSDRVEGMIGNYQRLVDGYLAGLDDALLVPAHAEVDGLIDTPCKDLGF
jgi:phenylpropionate dioxygenase-like ring-hydroxylating dioxygenase large terminal subunit